MSEDNEENIEREGEEEDQEENKRKNDKNNQENNEEQEDEEEQIEIEVEDRGMNTDELPPEELQRLVDNNKELQEENDVSNMDHEVKNDLALSKKELIDELNEKDKIFELLVKSNNELKNKIEISNKKYQDILNKIETKKNEDIERKLNLQIKEIEKEIKANNSETERYKKLIDQLKTKIEFKENLERASSIQYILKQETIKNKDLQNELNALKRINKVQSKYIDNYDKENQITEKLDMLKNEIKQNKDTIKDYQEKYSRLERFIRLVHEKILSLEMLIKKIKEPKNENKKLFTKEELKDTLELITNLKSQINDKRNQLNVINKESDAKMHKLLVQNKQIEIEYKENEKLNKILINKKNELKRNIKNVNIKNVNNIKFKTKMIKYNISSIPKNENNNIKDEELDNKELFNNKNENNINIIENKEKSEDNKKNEEEKDDKNEEENNKEKEIKNEENIENIENNININENEENKEKEEEKKVEDNKVEKKEKKKKKKNKNKEENKEENKEKDEEKEKEKKSEEIKDENNEEKQINENKDNNKELENKEFEKEKVEQNNEKKEKKKKKKKKETEN